MSTIPPLRYLSGEDVEALLPQVEERVAMARRAMVALVADADLPPKLAVHPRPMGSFGHAMPAVLRGGAADGSDDLLGMKWVVGFPTNPSDLPRIHGTVLLSDPRSGVPLAFVDAGPITAHRTAAVSGVALEAWGPEAPERVALLGAGVQARSHLPVIAHRWPGTTVVVHARDQRRLDSIRGLAGPFPGLRVESAPSLEAAATGAQVVITLISFGSERQCLAASAFAAASLVVAVDYDMCVPAAVALDASRFIVDEAGQFLADRDRGLFAGYPDPWGSIGQALAAPPARDDGAVLVTHLGVGLADLVFTDALVRAAEREGRGMELPR